MNDHIHGPERARLDALPIISDECYTDDGECPMPGTCGCPCHSRGRA